MWCIVGTMSTQTISDEIVQYPDTRLDTPARDVLPEEMGEIPEFARRLRTAMRANRGIGISANQIGSPLNVCIVRDLTMVNPTIVASSSTITTDDEGCLSVNRSGTRYAREAYDWVLVHYQTVLGKWQTRKFSGLDARCVQHELRHLSGKLINEDAEIKIKGE